MARTPSPEPPLSPACRAELLAVARAAIEAGLEGRRLAIRVRDYPDPLRDARASFVSLECAGQLRGCVGTVIATRALVQDVARNARAAAFEDPRFPPLARGELSNLNVRISVLSALEPIPCRSRAELLAQIRPHVDGLLLEDGPRRATLLPAVWPHVPDADAFLRLLCRKAGLPDDHWSPTLAIKRYTTDSIP